MDEAINAWRRATSTDDRTTAVIALAEACEFYANGIEIHVFTDEERAAIGDRAVEGLDDDRRDRVLRLLERLNDPSFRTRLGAGLTLDRVPHDDAEVNLLTRLYSLRSKILHGSERKLPSHDELRQAIAFVNRMIVFRLHRLDAELGAEAPPDD